MALARIFKLLRNPRIDSKEPIPPGCVDWGNWYDNPILARSLAPIDCLKIPALFTELFRNVPALAILKDELK